MWYDRREIEKVKDINELFDIGKMFYKTYLIFKIRKNANIYWMGGTYKGVSGLVP